jgi:hypothetical protein
VTGQRGREASGRWWLALLALPILCCAGTALFAALGAGSLIVAVGGLAGSALLAAAGVAILLAAAVLALRRRVRR